MDRSLSAAVVACVCASVALPQNATFPSYKNQDEYCAANPKMPTCIKTNLDASKLNLSGLSNSGSGLKTSGPRPAAAAKETAIPVTLPDGKLDWRFAHQNPAALMSVNVQAIAASPILEAVLKQLTGPMGSRLPGLNASGIAKTRALLANIDRIGVSIRSAGQNPQAVALMTGRFDDAFLAAGDVDPAERAAFRNAGAMLVGDSASVSQASHRMETLKVDDPAVKNAAGWAAQYAIWMMGTPAIIPMPAGLLKGSAGAVDLSSVRTFSIGISFSSDLRMDVVLDTTSPQVAAQIAGQLRAGALRPEASRQPSNSVRIDTRGNAVQIAMSMDQKQLARQFPGAAGRNALQPAITIEGHKNPDAKPNTVVISGLDDGPKEIKLDPKN